MNSERSPADELANHVRRALADADVGLDASLDSLTALQAVEVRVAGSMATVTVELPIPSREFRGTIERKIRQVVREVDGITDIACHFVPRIPDPGAHVELIPDVKNVVAVASGKGGVGKSTVAVNLAAALADAGATVGLLDADVYGANAPAMLGLADRTPHTTLNDRMVPREAHGVKVMSMGFIVGEDDPVIWRGPLVDDFVKQLFGDVEWGALDYLIVDLPPGTGDAQLSLIQHLPVTGAVIVTTPPSVAVDDARRGLRGFIRYEVPILGVVENMSSFECPNCESDHHIFGAGGAEELSSEFGVPVLGRIPLNPEIGTLDDEDAPTPLGVSIPGIGRLQLPRTCEERERPTICSPIAVREDGGATRDNVRRLATQTAARIHRLVIERANDAAADQVRVDRDGSN